MSELTYSNPSKLMNYMRAQKAKGNSSFRSQAEYVSHVDAYARTTAQEAQVEQQDESRVRYAKLLAQKRLNDPVHKHHGAPRPPTKTHREPSNTTLTDPVCK